jgi:hypothetical protein
MAISNVEAVMETALKRGAERCRMGNGKDDTSARKQNEHGTPDIGPNDFDAALD